MPSHITVLHHPWLGHFGIQHRHHGLATAPVNKVASDTQACQGGKNTQAHTAHAQAHATVQPMHNDEARLGGRQDPRPWGQNKLVPLTAGTAPGREPRARGWSGRQPFRTVMLLVWMGVRGSGCIAPPVHAGRRVHGPADLVEMASVDSFGSLSSVRRRPMRLVTCYAVMIL